jgi:hypothetical protein
MTNVERRLTRGAVLLFVAFSAFYILPSAFAQTTNAFDERALSELTKPTKKVPFKTVLHATTGHRLIEFDTNNTAHVALRAKILKAAAMAGEEARREGISSTRANEAGNHLEPFVRAALKDAGLAARVPVNSNGRAQTTGYPDIELTGEPACYIELKTYSAATAHTTQRSFYYSPSATPKVTRDALHLLLAYELEKIERDGRSVFVPRHWKLLTLDELEVDLKFEFNQSNRGLYDQGRATLDEGAIADPPLSEGKPAPKQ